MVTILGVYGPGSGVGTPCGDLGVPRSRGGLLVNIRGVYRPEGGGGTPYGDLGSRGVGKKLNGGCKLCLWSRSGGGTP